MKPVTRVVYVLTAVLFCGVKAMAGQAVVQPADQMDDSVFTLSLLTEVMAGDTILPDRVSDNNARWNQTVRIFPVKRIKMAA